MHHVCKLTNTATHFTKMFDYNFVIILSNIQSSRLACSSTCFFELTLVHLGYAHTVVVRTTTSMLATP